VRACVGVCVRVCVYTQCRHDLIRCVCVWVNIHVCINMTVLCINMTVGFVCVCGRERGKDKGAGREE